MEFPDVAIGGYGERLDLLGCYNPGHYSSTRGMEALVCV
jgi:hypothetical protein